MKDLYPVGKRIQDARERLKISQEELADKVGMSQQALSKIEKGDSIPRESTLILLVRELNDDLGRTDLRKHLPKKLSPEEIARQIHSSSQGLTFINLDRFIVELAQINSNFCKMLKEGELERAREAVDFYKGEFMNAFENYGESVREEMWNNLDAEEIATKSKRKILAKKEKPQKTKKKVG